MCLLNKKNFSLSIFLSLMILSSNTLYSYQDKGTELYRSGDFKAAYREWRKLHIQNRNSTAQYNIGILYYYGRGFEKDYQTALLWFNRSAKQGHINSHFYIGEIYKNGGYGVKSNNLSAKYWFEEGSKLGSYRASKALADLYIIDAVSESDREIALDLYILSREQGNPDNLTREISSISSNLNTFNGNASDESKSKDIDEIKESIDQINSKLGNLNYDDEDENESYILLEYLKQKLAELSYDQEQALNQINSKLVKVDTFETELENINELFQQVDLVRQSLDDTNTTVKEIDAIIDRLQNESLTSIKNILSLGDAVTRNVEQIQTLRLELDEYDRINAKESPNIILIILLLLISVAIIYFAFFVQRNNKAERRIELSEDDIKSKRKLLREKAKKEYDL